MGASDISYWQLALGYGLLIFPMAVFLWHGVPLLGDTFMGVLRMTVQLLFIGFYLQYVFRWNNPWLNIGWIAVMVLVADASIVRGCGLRARIFLLPLSLSLLMGVLAPLLTLGLPTSATAAVSTPSDAHTSATDNVAAAAGRDHAPPRMTSP